MVQLVFVHGVNTRDDDRNYAKGVANRDQLFRLVAFATRASQIENPVWGDQAQTWAWDQECLPAKATRKKVESFSLMDGFATAPAKPNESPLPALAAKDLPAAVDLLYVAMVEQATLTGKALSPDQIADFAAAARQFEAWPEAGDPPTAILADDDALVAAIRQVAPSSYGLVDDLRNAAGRVVDKARNLASTGVVDLFRDDVNPMIGRFVGDVFVYLKEGDKREAIRGRIRPALTAARARADAAGEALVVMGHSMGGVILYDMLSDPGGAGLPDGFRVDVLATVGSQVGLFEEMKLYASSSPAYSKALNAKVPMPARVKSWMNVFDPVDVLSYRCEPIFEGVKDYVFSSATGLASAHTAYFRRPQFHARLKARLDALNVK